MKFKEFKHEPVQPDTYEASMALNQLMRIGKHAIKLHNMIDDAAEMESWVAKKIDLAGDYVKKVYNYTEGEKAGLYDDSGMTEIKKMPKGTGTMYGVKEDAPFGSGMDLVRMAVLRKFISAEEYMNYAKELKAAGEEVEEKYDDWPEGEGFGSSDGNFAIKDMMSAAGYEFDEQDTSGRFIVTKMPEKLEKMGIKNARMRDAVTTDSLEARLEAKLRESREQIGDYAREIKSGKIVRIVDYTDDDEGIYTISYGEDKGENDVTAKDLKFLDQTGGDQEEISKFEDKGSTMASRVIRNYAREIGADSMDYDMFVKSADLLDKEMLKSLAQHIENSDTAPREYVMKKIADHDPETFRKMYGDQEGYLSIMKPRKDLTDDESVSEDAGEGHMSKSTLYHTAKYAIALMDMIKPGDDLEGWVQSKLNKAADYLQGVYNYEEYQKLNPYREELDSNILQKHAGIVQKNIDEILAKETEIDDIDTKPGMMRILAKRVNEVEKKIAKETRKNTDEAHGGQHTTSGRSMTKGEMSKREKIVKGMKKNKAGFKKRYGKDAEAVMYATATKNAMKDDQQYDEGIKDWAKNLAMAGVFVAGLAGVGAIQDAIDNSVPAVKAMNTAYEMAVDAGNDELANMIKNDISAVKVRLESGKDLGFVKGMQDKYIKFMPTEGIAYESKLTVLLNQRLK